jgi:hypothetical protein
MGFNLSGLLGPALTTATNAAGTYQQGQANTANANTQMLLEVLKLKKDAEDGALRDALTRAQTGAYDALATQRNTDAGATGQSPTIPGVNPQLAAALSGVPSFSAPPNPGPISEGVGGPAIPFLNPGGQPKDIRDILLRNQGNLTAIGARGDQSRQTNAAKNVVPRFIPGATPGSYVMPQAPGNGPPVPQRLPGVTPSGGGTGDAQAAIAERQRVNGWRAAYSRALARYQTPQADPVTGLKTAAMSSADAQSQAAADASAAYGPPPQNTTAGQSPKGTPTGRGGTARVQPTPADSATAKIAAQRIKSGQATLAQAMASPSLSDGVKALLQAGYTGNE